MRAAGAGLRVVDSNPMAEIDPRAAWSLRRCIRRESIDVVHAHTAHAVALGALATLGTNVPLVASRRVDFPLRRNAATRWKYGRAAAIIAISGAVARVLERSGVDSATIVVVPDGTDLHRAIVPATPETLSALDIVPGRPLVVQVSQLVGHKDPVNFVGAIACAREIVPDVQALLVGDGPLRADVESAIHSLGLRDVVRVAGYRTDADALLAAADVVCLSSREEGMGSVLLDALVLGLPVAATRAGGIPEVVADGETGLLAEVRNQRALGDAIAKLLRDPALRATMGAAARKRAGDFSVERMTDRTLEVYERVAARSRTARSKAASSSSPI